SIFVFGISGVDLFFALSGFIMVHTTRNSPPSWRSLLHFLERRAARIYPLYWIYTSVILVTAVLLPQAIQRPELEQISVMKSLLLVPQAHQPILAVGWTLIFEMYFYLVFAFMLLAPRRFLPHLLCLWLAAVIASSASGNNPFVNVLTSPLTAEFILGCAAGLAANNYKRSGGAAALVGLLNLAAGVFLQYFTAGPVEPSGWLRVLLFGIPSVLLVYGMGSRDYAGAPKLLPRFLSSVGDCSYSIYLSHFLIISALARAGAWISAKLPSTAFGPVDNWCYLTAALLLSLSFGAASWHLLERPLLAVFRRH
ncbi:MAG TPA: acyltransferase, partial [Oligoflexia bacterium]|nr:acyltransferase [Oligoflexia bacterium]